MINIDLEYMPGFGNDFETECLPGALPQGQNSPQRCAYGLYAEQLSGSPFTAPRGTNERSWLYRIRPSVRHNTTFDRVFYRLWKTGPYQNPDSMPLQQTRWMPIDVPETPCDFVSGVRTITVAGDASTLSGSANHMYVINKTMQNHYFYNCDAEMLIVPQMGDVVLFTEMGRMRVGAGDICVIPRGCKFKVELYSDVARGYICENYGAKFTLPERGPIGANCLANARDFKTPVACYEDKDGVDCTLTIKWGGQFYETKIQHSPLDVVAWHGNYTPYKYDLRTYAPVGAIAFDHPDPSIFTVLTAPSATCGTANVDFVIFPERWMVAEHTFRPPWYHSNIMSEFMGLIYGQYDAKEDGFVPGGASLHNCMMPHGPDNDAFERATKMALKPVKLTNTMAFMFETHFPQHMTEFACDTGILDNEYTKCWNQLKRRFDGSPEIK